MTEFYAAERWLPIAGFEGLYEVSDFGRVRSLDRMVESRNHPRQQQRLLRGRLLRQTTNKPTANRYIRKQVKLHRGNNLSTFNVARLVAQAFIPNPLNYPFVLHLDDDATNNKASNLEWGTHQENCFQAASRDRMRYGQEHWQSSLSDVDRSMAYEMLLEGERINDVAQKFNVSRQSISDLKRGKIKGYEEIKRARTGLRGVESKRSMLAERQAIEIKRKLRDGCKCISLAKEYGVAPSTISAIKRGVNWWWLEVEERRV
jgi:hypothetical protein